MENTRNTTRDEPRAGALLLAGACALVLLALSVPRAISGLYALPGNPALERMNGARPVTLDDLWVLAESRYQASAWSDNPRYRIELGTALLRLVVARGAKQLDKEQLAVAMDEFRAGLAAAPVDRDGWAQLALAEHLRAGPSKRVAAYLRMSILAGSADRRLALLRLDLAARNWRHIEPVDRELVLSQARLAWVVAPRRVLLSTRNKLRLAIVRAALSKNSKALQRFEIGYARMKKSDRRHIR